MSKDTRRAELAHKRQIRENACSLSIDTISRHNLFVEPQCARAKYFDLLLEVNDDQTYGNALSQVRRRLLRRGGAMAPLEDTLP